MRYTVTGADRQTGEDIEITVEAQTPDEARAKAHRRGIVVADCAAADLMSLASAAAAADHSASPKRGQRNTKRPAKLSRHFVTLGVLAAICAGVYFGVVRPQGQKVRQTLDEAIETMDRTEQMADKATKRWDAEVSADTHLSEGDNPPQPTVGTPSAVETAANLKLAGYVGVSAPFVREIKALRSRVGEGTSYDDLSEKLGEVGDEYAQIGEPPEDADAVAFATAAASAMDTYRQAERRWAFAIRNNLFIAEKYKIREMFEAADTQVGSLEAKFNLMRSRLER